MQTYFYFFIAYICNFSNLLELFIKIIPNLFFYLLKLFQKPCASVPQNGKGNGCCRQPGSNCGRVCCVGCLRAQHNSTSPGSVRRKGRRRRRGGRKSGGGGGCRHRRLFGVWFPEERRRNGGVWTRGRGEVVVLVSVSPPLPPPPTLPALGVHLWFC